MQTLMRRKSLQYVISSLVAVAAIVSLASWQQIVADGTANTGEQLTDAEQLANDVEVNVPQQLRVAGKHTYSVTVTLTARKDKSVTGPIYLVVQGTGIDTLQAKEPDGVTGEEEPYFLILPEVKKLSATSRSVSQKISFKSDGRLRSKSRREFKLDYRLTRDVSQRVGKTADRTDRRPRESRLAGTPRSGGARSGRKQQNRSDDEDPAPSKNGDGNNANKREPFALKPEITDKEVKRVMAIQDKWTKELLKTEGVIGTATGVNIDGDLVIRIYTSRYGIDKDVPKVIQGIPVQAKVVGRFRRMFQPPQDKRGRAGSLGPRGTRGILGGQPPISDQPAVDDPQQRFSRPVPIGISAFNITLPPGVPCDAGTIGCRLKGADGTLYALSNNHVFANDNNAPIGDPILQPSSFDNNCSTNPSDAIGTLAAFVPTDFSLGGTNQVDAAVARVTAATLSNRTPKGAYGTPNSKTVVARLGMKVQKMGRTTKHTTGRVTCINVAAMIGGGPNGVINYVDQIEIQSFIVTIDPMTGIITVTSQPFQAGGDSGSLVVTTYGKNPVGLAFAGSVFISFSNPIDAVLEQIGQQLGQTVTIDGGLPPIFVPPSVRESGFR
jgi:hypothetical protein